jgi:hypothetical protein
MIVHGHFKTTKKKAKQEKEQSKNASSLDLVLET